MKRREGIEIEARDDKTLDGSWIDRLSGGDVRHAAAIIRPHLVQSFDSVLWIILAAAVLGASMGFSRQLLSETGLFA
jgi:hypothetical protein